MNPKKIKIKPVTGDFLFFNVVYEDGSHSSNRKVPSADMPMFDAEGAIKAMLEAQDRKIAALSGNPRGRIKSITQVFR